MPKGVRADLSGQQFAQLRVLAWAPSRRLPGGSLAIYYACQCTCGTTKEIQAQALNSGAVVSCGCHKDRLLKERATTHGLYQSAAYRVWHGMVQRCTCEKMPGYKNYGGRGITVCDRWRTFENFFADMGHPPPKLTLERIDNDSGYGPDNCKWATRTEQNLNQRPRQRAA